MTTSDLPIDEPTLLAQIGRALVSAADVPKILGEVCGAAARLCRADRCSVYLVDAEAAESVPAMSQFADGRRFDELWSQFRSGHRRALSEMRFIDRLVSTQVPLTIDDARSSDAIESIWVERFGIKSVLGLPLAMERRVVGALVLDTVAEVRPFGARQLVLAQAVADQLTLFIHKRVLVERLERRLQHAEVQLQIAQGLGSPADLPALLRTAAREVARACGMDQAIIYLDEGDVLVPMAGSFRDDRPGGEPADLLAALGPVPRDEAKVLAGLAERQAPLVSSWSTDDPWLRRVMAFFDADTAILVPLLRQQRTIGALLLMDAAPTAVSEEQLAMAATLGAQVALVIDNARLHREVAQRLRETEGLLSLAGQLGGSLDRVELARRAAREVSLLLDADTSFVLRFDVERGAAMPLAGYHVPEGVLAAGAPEYSVTTAEVSQDVIDAFRTGRPLACADVTTDHRFDHPFLSVLPRRPRGLVVIPLLARGRPYGAVVSFWWDRRHVLSSGGLRVAAGVANQVSLALQNAELYEEATKALADLKTAQDQLVRGHTLRALGELAGGTAHHLNNLLAVIVARVELLLETVKDEGGRRPLTIIDKAAVDAAEVVRRVQEFTQARPQARAEAVDLREVVVDAVEMTRGRWDDAARAAGVRIDVVQNLTAVPAVSGDAAALREVMMNLLLNAVDALPKGGTIEVTTRAEGPWVSVTVRDTGVGMSPDVRQRAMEPFFTTKDLRRTGLGLSAAYGIVTRHRGLLSLESEEGRGTTVMFQLPALAAPVAEAPRPPRAAHAGPLRVLVVDDEEEVREALAMILRRNGHVVATAPSGAAALAHLSTGLVVDLVLTDLGMPDVTGWTVALTVKERWPGLPVGLITGWGENPEGTPTERGAVDFVLTKPIDRRALTAALAHVAQRRAAA